VPSETSARLASRSSAAGLALPSNLAEKLAAYYDLLQRWNRKINLTGLSDPDESIDRLLLEPIAAAAALPQSKRLIDLGSGGGSPAIPLALAVSASLLVMVESRSRKAAFLREAVRELGLAGVVENARFEDVALRSEYGWTMDTVSLRAVRIDPTALDAATAFLSAEGRIALFGNQMGAPLSLPAGLIVDATVPLLRNSGLTVLRRT
jgi:16S rRNA (guanine527-N7)-methyltransferase